MDAIGFVDEPLFLNANDMKNQWDIRNNQKLYWPSKPPTYYFIQFLVNNIQSNIFINQSGKLNLGAGSY